MLVGDLWPLGALGASGPTGPWIKRQWTWQLQSAVIVDFLCSNYTGWAIYDLARLL